MSLLNPDNESVRTLSQTILSFLRQYRWLIDAYLSDYFVENLPGQLPPQWRQLFEQLEPKELASLLRSDTWISKHVWPLSLLSFRSFATQLCMDRSWRIASKTELASALLCENKQKGGSDTSECFEEDSIPPESEAATDHPKASVVNGQYRKLEHCYRRHVKPKKQHEILSLGKNIHNLCSLCECDHVVDVGSGQGHLSRILSFGYGVKVTTVEAAGCHLPKAEKFDCEVTRDIQKKQFHTKQGKKTKKKLFNSDEFAVIKREVDVVTEVPRPRHLVSMIDPQIPVQEFLERLQLDSSEELSSKNHSRKTSGNSHESDNSSFECIESEKQSNNNNHNDLDKTRDTQDYPYTTKGRNSPKSTCDCGKTSEGIDGFTAPHTQPEQRTHTSADKADTVPDLHVQHGYQCQEDTPTSSSSFSDKECCPQFILAGLHACGDLTPTLLRVFVQSPQAMGIASVGCCYMKMSLSNQDEPSASHGYPMSDFVKSLDNHEMSYEAMEMACHFVENYWKRLLDGSPNLRTHCYRSALQEIISQKDPTIKHGCIKLTVKNMDKISFQEYATKALGKLGLNPELTETQLTAASERTARWKDVVAFYTLRLSLAPLIETVVLLDRLLYLRERGVHCCLLPVFDPEISPRNFVLLGRKD